MKIFLSCLAVAVLTGIAPAAFGHSYGPAPRITGAPGDNAKACTQCHTTNALNSGSGKREDRSAKRSVLHTRRQTESGGSRGRPRATAVGL